MLEIDIDFLEKLLKNPMISMIDINNQQLSIKLEEKFCLIDFLRSETFFVSKKLNAFNKRTEDDVKIALAVLKKYHDEIEKTGKAEYTKMSFEELDLEIAELELYNIKNPIESEKCYIYRRELPECFKPFVRKNLKKIVEVLRIVIPKEAAEDVFIINYAKKIIPGFDLEKNCITVKNFKETTGKSTDELFDIVWEGLNLGLLRLNPSLKDICCKEFTYEELNETQTPFDIGMQILVIRLIKEEQKKEFSFLKIETLANAMGVSENEIVNLVKYIRKLDHRTLTEKAMAQIEEDNLEHFINYYICVNHYSRLYLKTIINNDAEMVDKTMEAMVDEVLFVRNTYLDKKSIKIVQNAFVWYGKYFVKIIEEMLENNYDWAIIAEVLGKNHEWYEWFSNKNADKNLAHLQNLKRVISHLVNIEENDISCRVLENKS